MTGQQTITSVLCAAVRLIPASRYARQKMFEALDIEKVGDTPPTTRQTILSNFRAKVRAYESAERATAALVSDFNAAASVFSGTARDSTSTPNGIEELALTIGANLELARLCDSVADQGAAILKEAHFARAAAEPYVLCTEAAADMLQLMIAHNFDRNAPQVRDARKRFNKLNRRLQRLI